MMPGIVVAGRAAAEFCTAAGSCGETMQVAQYTVASQFEPDAGIAAAGRVEKGLSGCRVRLEPSGDGVIFLGKVQVVGQG